MDNIRYTFNSYLIPEVIGFMPCENIINEIDQQFPQEFTNLVSADFSKQNYLISLTNSGYDYPIEHVDKNGFLILVINSKKQRTVQLTVNKTY